MITEVIHIKVETGPFRTPHATITNNAVPGAEFSNAYNN
jgi:hypothetical protein